MRSLRTTIGTMLMALTLAGATMQPPRPLDQPVTNPAAVEGQGFWAALACAGCVGGAVGIAMSGTAAIVAALAAEGSTLVAAACVAVCIEAFE